MSDETGIESLISKHVPVVESSSWKGVSSAQLKLHFTNCDIHIPSFYIWFAQNLGAHFPHPKFGHERLDLRICTCREVIANDEFAQNNRYLAIGRAVSGSGSSILYYDLEQRKHDDALIVSRFEDSTKLVPRFETLREMISYGLFRRHCVYQSPAVCEGYFSDSSGRTGDILGFSLDRLQFHSLVRTGSYCTMRERGGISFVGREPLQDANGKHHFFEIGGPSESDLRALLGEISESSSLKLRIIETI